MNNRYLKGIILFLAITFGVFSVAFAASAQSSWQLSDYDYRREIRMSNPANFLNDFQILTVVDTASLIAEGKMRPDCSDARFVGSNGVTLNHWLEAGCNSGWTRFWTKVPTVPGGVSFMYMYYGNSSAQNVGGNIDAVMDNGLRIWNDHPSFDLAVLSLESQELMNFLRRVGTCVEYSVSHNWSGTPYISGCSLQNGSATKLVWSGWVINKGVGNHSFTVSSDNKARLYVGGELILEKSSDNVTNVSGNYSFSYPATIQMDFVKNYETASISLGWSPADGSGAQTPIPAENLRTNKTAFPNAEPEAGVGPEGSRAVPAPESSSSSSSSSSTQQSSDSNNYSYSNTNNSSSNTSASYYSQSNTSGEFTKKIKNMTSGASEGYLTEAVAGETLRYTLTLQSSKNFYGARIIDVLPQGVAFISADSGASYDPQNNVVRWDLGDLSSPTKSYSYQVRVSNNLSNGQTVVNTALLESRDYSFQSNEAKFNLKAPQIIITREMLGQPRDGADMSYLITYKNTGSLPARVFVREEYSGGIKFKGSSPAPSGSAENYALFEIINLVPSSSGTITVDLTKDSSVPKGAVATIDGKTDYYDDRGNKYPQIASKNDIDLDSGKFVYQQPTQPESAQPAEGNNEQGKVKGATDVQAGSYDNALLAAIISMLGVVVVFTARSNNFSKMKLSYELWRERRNA